jgi:hypothetical protein
VTNVGNDRAQLLAMGQQARDVMGCEEITALADRGYFNGDEVLARNWCPALRSQDADLRQHQARPLYRAGF